MLNSKQRDTQITQITLMTCRKILSMIDHSQPHFQMTCRRGCSLWRTTASQDTRVLIQRVLLSLEVGRDRSVNGSVLVDTCNTMLWKCNNQHVSTQHPDYYHSKNPKGTLPPQFKKIRPQLLTNNGNYGRMKNNEIKRSRYLIRGDSTYWDSCYTSVHIRPFINNFTEVQKLFTIYQVQLVTDCTVLEIVGLMHFSVAGAHVWNALPADVTSAPSLFTFKNVQNCIFSQSPILALSSKLTFFLAWSLW